MVSGIVTLVRFFIALIVTVFLLILFPIEILIRLIFTIIVSIFSRSSAEGIWDGFPLVFQNISGLWSWVSDYD